MGGGCQPTIVGNVGPVVQADDGRQVTGVLTRKVKMTRTVESKTEYCSRMVDRTCVSLPNGRMETDSRTFTFEVKVYDKDMTAALATLDAKVAECEELGDWSVVPEDSVARLEALKDRLCTPQKLGEMDRAVELIGSNYSEAYENLKSAANASEYLDALPTEQETLIAYLQAVKTDVALRKICGLSPNAPLNCSIWRNQKYRPIAFNKTTSTKEECHCDNEEPLNTKITSNLAVVDFG